MANEMQIFNNEEFGQVRTIEVDGKILFCGSDIAKALGYSKPNNAISAHCRATLKWSTPISGKMQEINFIPEGDVYRLIVRSKLPSAEKFEAWVFDEVLPSIRETGKYSVQQKQDSYLIDDKVERAKRWIEEQEYTLSLARQIEADKPFTEHGKIVSDSTDCVDFAEFPKMSFCNTICNTVTNDDCV